LSKGASKTKCFLFWSISTREGLPLLPYTSLRYVRNCLHGLETHHEFSSTSIS